jgi:hypothetical protein
VIDIFMDLAFRVASGRAVMPILGVVVSAVGVIGLSVPRLLGLVSNIDPTFWVMVLVGAVAAAGNAWIEYQWRARRRAIDVKIYERQKRIDLAIYEKQREKDTGFDIEVVNTPDPD